MKVASRRWRHQLRNTFCPLAGFSVACLVTVFATSFAQASDSDLAAKKRAAKTACLSGDYSRGVALLAEVYVDTNNPIHIFNQGRCFQQNGRYEDAVLRFREYQRKNADAGGAPDPEAEKQIADCLSLLEIQKAREAESRAADTGAAGGGAVPPVGGVQPVVGAATGTAGTSLAGGTGPTVPAGPAPMSIQKKLGWLSIGLAVAGGVTSMITYFIGRSALDKAGELGCTDTHCVGEARSEYNRAQTAVTVSNATGIASGVFLVGGIVLILTAPSTSATGHGVALVPVMGPGLAQIALTGRF